MILEHFNFDLKTVLEKNIKIALIILSVNWVHRSYSLKYRCDPRGPQVY